VDRRVAQEGVARDGVRFGDVTGFVDRHLDHDRALAACRRETVPPQGYRGAS
jgi:hypothetical protein